MERNSKFLINTKSTSNTLNKNVILVVLVLFGLSNIFLNVIPTMIFVFIILFIQFYSMNKYESAFLLSLFANVLGTFFSIKGIRGVGSVLILISFLIFVFDFKYLLKKYLTSLIPLLLVFIILIISVVVTKGGDYAQNKLLNTISSGLMSSFAFAHFFYYNHKYRPYLISVFTVVYAIFILKYTIDFYDFDNPKNLFEIGFIRNMIVDLKISDMEIKINYQSIGFMGVFALSFLFFSSKINTNKIFYYFVYFTAILVVIYSGSRQAMLTTFIIICFDILRKNKNKLFVKNLVFLTIFVTLVIYTLQQLDVWFISDFIRSDNLIEASGRSELINLGFKQFYENPLIGVGYGRYKNPDNVYGGSPHNIFIELLSETGTLGFFLFVVILVFFIIKNFNSFKKNKNVLFGINCVLISYFIKSLVSADLSYNIEFFAILFMLPLFRAQNIKTNLKIF